jgi:hypothetical protein
MPIEIRELVIRIVVNDEDADGESDAETADDGSLSEKEAIIQECVRQVLRILQKAEER